MAVEGSGWGEGRMRVSRQGRRVRGRSRSRLNGTEPYVIARHEHGGAGGAPADVGGENCAQGQHGEAQQEGARGVVSGSL